MIMVEGLLAFVGIVEDELDIAVLFYYVLRTIKEIQVFKFTDPIMALGHIKINAKDYVLVISDLRMPVINGIQLLKTIKHLNPLTRTILTTAFLVEDNIFQEYLKNETINGFLQKPIELEQLLLEVNKQINFIENVNII